MNFFRDRFLLDFYMIFELCASRQLNMQRIKFIDRVFRPWYQEIELKFQLQELVDSWIR